MQAAESHADVWRRYDEVEARLSASLSERMVELCALSPGDHVLDLATGRGEPALAAARRVAPDGTVVGIELDAGVLELAKARAAHEGIDNLDLRVGDATRLGGLPIGHFHAVTCRWGLMFMADPVAAMVGARKALRGGGAVVLAMWAEPARVSWFSLPRDVLAPLMTPPLAIPPIDPEAPGVFRFADRARIERDLGRAGLEVDHVEEMFVPVFEAERAEEIALWCRTFGLDKLLVDVSPDDRRAWEAALLAELERRRSGGMIQIGGVTRIVRARPV